MHASRSSDGRTSSCRFAGTIGLDHYHNSGSAAGDKLPGQNITVFGLAIAALQHDPGHPCAQALRNLSASYHATAARSSSQYGVRRKPCDWLSASGGQRRRYRNGETRQRAEKPLCADLPLTLLLLPLQLPLPSSPIASASLFVSPWRHNAARGVASSWTAPRSLPPSLLRLAVPPPLRPSVFSSSPLLFE